jgi:hypothetical protein
MTELESVLAQSKEFQTILAKSRALSADCLTEESRASYLSRVWCVERGWAKKISGIPFGSVWNTEAVMVMLQILYDEGHQYSHLAGCATGLSYLLRKLGLPDFLAEPEVEAWKKAVRKAAKGDAPQYAKEGATQQDVLDVVDLYDPADPMGRLYCALITTGHFCLLRGAEIVNLTPEDIHAFATPGGVVMEYALHESKTDQTGAGESVFVAVTDPVPRHHPYLFFNWGPHDANHVKSLVGYPPGEPLWPHSKKQLRHQFQCDMQLLGRNPLLMGLHSLRIGAAMHVSAAGVPDSVIQKHGRWRSDSFLRYVRVEALRAGCTIATALCGPV